MDEWMYGSHGRIWRSWLVDDMLRPVPVLAPIIICTSKCVLISTPAFVNSSNYISVPGTAPVYTVYVLTRVVIWSSLVYNAPSPTLLPLLLFSSFLSFILPTSFIPRLSSLFPCRNFFTTTLLHNPPSSLSPPPVIQHAFFSSQLFPSFHQLFLLHTLVLIFSSLFSNPNPLLRYSLVLSPLPTMN